MKVSEIKRRSNVICLQKKMLRVCLCLRTDACLSLFPPGRLLQMRRSVLSRARRDEWGGGASIRSGLRSARDPGRDIHLF